MVINTKRTHYMYCSSGSVKLELFCTICVFYSYTICVWYVPYAYIVSRSQTLFSHRGVIAFSISALLERGSGRVYRVYSVFTLMNVLIIRLSLWPRALKRWFFMLRDEMEFGEVVRWISLHSLKQNRKYKRLAFEQFWSHLSTQ